MEEKHLRQQGARCMDCGIPFCHTGTLISGMASRLPDQQPDSGVERSGLPRPVAGGARPPAQDEQFPRVHRPRLPRAVRRLLRARHQRAAGHDQEHRGRDHRPRLGGRLGRARSRRRSAPARRSPSSAPAPPASAAAAQLNQAGHTVTVFERADRPGGLLMYGIPNMKLDKREVVLRRIKLHGAGRRQVRLQHRTSATTSRPKLLLQGFRRRRPLHRRHQAARPARRRPQPQGHPLRDGLPDRATPRRCSTAAPTRSSIHARGKDVIVIGGGDTGTDCVGTSMRHGCRSLVQLEILPKPPLERAADNPWPEWPKVYKTGLRPGRGRREVRRRPARLPDHRQEVRRRRQGQRQGTRHRRRSSGSKNDKGQFVPQARCPAPSRRCPAQLVLLAMGFLGPGAAAARRNWASNATRAPTSRPSTAVHDQPQGRLRRRRLPPRPEPGRLGHQRRPRRRPRVRPLPDGEHRAALGT